MSPALVVRWMSYEDGQRPPLLLPTNTPTYRSYSSMLNRCSCKNNPAWRHYGGRGIMVAKEWVVEKAIH